MSNTMVSSGTSWFTPSVLIVTIIAALDHADSSLLNASFPLLEKTLDLDTKWMGYLSLCGNLSYALSLPLWGWLIHQYRLDKVHILLGVACGLWGLSTLGTVTFWNSLAGQATFRALTGISLGSLLPMTQTILVELVPRHMKGRAFGVMGWMEKGAATLAASALVYFESYWIPYGMVAILSICMSVVSCKYLRVTEKMPQNQADDERLSYKQIMMRISRMKILLLMIGQGLFGGIPWNMMSFCLLLMKWRKFTNEQIVFYQFTSGFSSMTAGAIGGFLGDYFGRNKVQGRIYVAIVSKIGSILFFVLFCRAQDFRSSCMWYNLMLLWAGWTQASTIRPLCADLARNPSERAQIVAFWLLLEKISSSFLGAPLVGLITQHMLQQGDQEDPNIAAKTLATNLAFLASFFWILCICFWVLMLRSLRQSGLTSLVDMKYELTKSKEYMNV